MEKTFSYGILGIVAIVSLVGLFTLISQPKVSTVTDSLVGEAFKIKKNTGLAMVTVLCTDGESLWEGDLNLDTGLIDCGAVTVVPDDGGAVHGWITWGCTDGETSWDGRFDVANGIADCHSGNTA